MLNLQTDPRGAIFIDPAAFTDMARWHEVAAELRRDAPVLRVEADGWVPFFALTRYADVQEVSRRSDLFWNTPHSAPGPDLQYELLQAAGLELPRTLVHLHGQEHGEYRAVTNDWFKPAAVKGLQPTIDEIAATYVARLEDMGGECDLAQDLAVPFTIHVIMSIFGVPERDEPMMMELTQGLFGAADPEYLGGYESPTDLIEGSITKFRDYFDAVSADRRARPTGDLATVIANGEVHGCPMGETERLWYYIIVATAGHDTTSFALAGGLAELLRHPEQLGALMADPAGLARNAADEMIRWTSPVRSFFRWAQADTEIHGAPIEEGDVVLTSYPSANRDEDVFDRPMEFDIERPDAFKLLSFGLGMHFCLGSQVARREVHTMLRHLFERIDTIEPAGAPEWSLGHFVSGVKHLPVRYTLK